MDQEEMEGRRWPSLSVVRRQPVDGPAVEEDELEADPDRHTRAMAAKCRAREGGDPPATVADDGYT
jgi:hypothetical protein